MPWINNNHTSDSRKIANIKARRLGSILILFNKAFYKQGLDLNRVEFLIFKEDVYSHQYQPSFPHTLFSTSIAFCIEMASETLFFAFTVEAIKASAYLCDAGAGERHDHSNHIDRQLKLQEL